MKNAKKLFVIVAMTALLLFTMSSCKIDVTVAEYSYKFINNSSHLVTVECSDLTPSSFTVNTGASKTVKSKKSSIKYTYIPSIYVQESSDGKGNITFTNR